MLVTKMRQANQIVEIQVQLKHDTNLTKTHRFNFKLVLRLKQITQACVGPYKFKNMLT